MKQKIIIVGNWKMAPDSLREACSLFQKSKEMSKKVRNVQTVICAPFIYLTELKKLAVGQTCVLGAQNISHEKENAFTGEISPAQLKNVGVKYVIIGHSERRAMGETNDLIAKKIIVTTTSGLTTILCVGESVRDDNGNYISFLKTQLLESLVYLTPKNISRLIIVYEPLWSVGKYTKHIAKPEDILEISIFIKKILIDKFGKNIVKTIPVLYGGSVNPNNALDFLTKGGVGGLLVGRASLRAKDFTEIQNIANNI